MPPFLFWLFAGVMLVFGANMRGKTSLLNAIRWALFGRALDRHSRDIDLIDIQRLMEVNEVE